MRILILGGTAEARALAEDLHGGGVAVISTLAGRVSAPRLPPGEVRIGGFGGPEPLAQWLSEQRIAAVVDATHPFAERISASAVQAATRAGIPLLRLERPGWTAGDGDRWHWADDLAHAAFLLQRLGAGRVFLTTGRQGLHAFAGEDAWFLIRCVDPPQTELPRNYSLLLERGPFTLDGERALLDAHGIDVLVTKDSGGAHTEAKLHAARERGVPVVIVRRPPRPAAETVAGVAEAAAWARRYASG
jgi:precorrin-6A/cobalt-precorrin-6A reductase